MSDLSDLEKWSDGVEDQNWSSPWEPLPGVRTGEQLTRGEKAADNVRNRMGSWGFVFAFLGVMMIWALVNSFWLANKGFDPYPFILLNLFLSMLAGLQGAILLIAAKRADAVAAEQALSHLTMSKSSSEMLHVLTLEVKEVRHLVKEVTKILEIEREEHGA